MASSIDPDEVAHDEPPHQDLCCMQIQFFIAALKCVYFFFTIIDFHIDKSSKTDP